MTTRIYIAAVWAAALGAVMAVAFALAGRGTFEHRVLAAGIAIAGAVLLLVALALQMMARRSGSRGLPAVACGTAVLGILGVSQIESIMIGAVVHNRDLRAARAYGERVVAQLDALRNSGGRYPAALEDAVRGLPPAPYLFQRSCLFTSSGDEFVLSFNEADAVIPHVVQYSSSSSRWARF
jgi:hypothetical protein